MTRIYLDNAATTEIDQNVIRVMTGALGNFGNPSSIHTIGQEARKVVDQARDAVAEFLNCKPTEVIFTSGGSEADNLAIKGVINSFCGHPELVSGSRNKFGMTASKPHIITTAIEHHAVLHTIQNLEKEGKIEATYVKPDKNGVINVEDIKEVIKDNTLLISTMYVNNETGCVQPIREIGKMIERINTLRSKHQVASSKVEQEEEKPATNYQLPAPENKIEKIYFHTDAVQAAEYLNMDVNFLHTDLLTLTAHKIHGPKGIGVLYVKKGTPVDAEIEGGNQEFKLRAGTENVPAIAGLSASIAEVKAQSSKLKAVELLRNKLEQSILKTIPDTYLNGDKINRAPHITNISFKNAEGEAIILNLDFLGIAVSSGSACTSRSLDPSHVLSAMGIPHELSHGAIRFSLSRETTEEEIEKVLEVLPGIIKKLREMSPFK